MHIRLRVLAAAVVAAITSFTAGIVPKFFQAATQNEFLKGDVENLVD